MCPQDAPKASKMLHKNPKTSPSTPHKNQTHVKTNDSMHSLKTCNETLEMSHIASPPASENQSRYPKVVAHRWKVQSPVEGRWAPEGFAIQKHEFK